MKFPARPQSSCAAVFRRAAHFQIAVVSMLLPGLTIWTSPVMANPRGGTVIHGDVSFGPGTGGNLQIRQNSRNAIIDWESFSIEAGELTQFRQPNSNAAVLNRVTGGDPSAIHGALRANGNVFVINPNGILVGPGGTIDVHGLVLSTLDVSNGEFLAGGDMTFAGVGEGVTNLGRINAIGGDVFLIGRTVTNSGSISATGTVGLAAGEEVLLTAGESATGERMFVRAKGSGVSGTGIFNDGTIEGAAVELKAHGNIYALAINNKGSIRATGATTSGGRVFLRGAGGTVENSGSIRATSSGSGNGGRVLIEAAYAKVDGMIRAQGGQVRITGTDKVEMSADLDATNSGGLGGDVVVEGGDIVLGNGTNIDASGATGGGNVRVGGGFQGRDTTVRNADTLTVESGAVVRSDALVNGAGGNVILWADNDTLFNGEVTARGFSRGGFAEISGKQNLGFDGLVDLTAENGPAGSLLLDPTNVTIGTGANSATNINNIALSNSLDLGTNVIIATNYGGAGPRGDITIVAGEATAVGQNMGGIEWYQQSASTVGGTLSLLAMGNILFANDVRSAGAGGINIVAGWNGTTGLLAPIDPLNGTQAQTSGGFDMALVLATLNDGNVANDAAGLNSGSVFINGYDINGAALNTVSEGIEVGSRFGATRVAAHDLLIRGVPTGQGWAQLGFRDSGNEFGLNGTIAITTQNGERNEWWGSNGAANGSGGATQFGNIQNKDYIALLGGTVESGPGGLGAFKGAGYGATGAIEVGLSGRLDVRGGDSGNAYAQIGHGGTGAEGVEIARNAQGIGQVSVTTRDGAVIDVADNNRTYFGTSWRTNYQGASARVNADITIKAAEDILIMAPSSFETNVGYTDLSNNDGNGNRYVMVGHGGMDNFGSYHGNISVIALGATTALDGRGLAGSGIQLRAGMGSLNPAQIGHGGFHEGNRRTIFDQTSSGNVTVRAETGAVRVLGYNLLPRTGDSVSGPYANLSTILPANSGNDTEYEFSNVQIGHGGWHRDRVATGGTFTAPVGFTATAVLPDQSMTGNIEVYAGGTVQVRDNMGYDQFGNWTADPGPGFDPQLTAGGILREVGIEVRAGNNGNAYGLIGHGGFNMNSNTTGTINGNIGVTAAKGTVLFVGGEEKRSQRDWGYGGNYVQVGHGGYDSDAMNSTSGFSGSISVLAGQGGTNGLGQTITPLDGDLIFRTGRAGESWAQIGHGGRSSNGDLVIGGVSDGVAPITVTARDGIEFTGRISNPTLATVLSTDYNVLNVANPSGIGGDGNTYVGQGTGNIVDEDTRPQVSGRGLTYNIDIKHAQIGHGGFDFLVDNQPTRNFSLNNDITVNAQTGGLRFTASNANNDYIMIGMGGLDGGNQRNITGADIIVNADDEIVFDASNPGVLEWNRVPVSGSLGYEARQHSRGARGFAMIGNGGYDVDGDFTGTITVTTGGQLQMLSSGVGTVNTVTGYIGNTVSGPAAATGTTITTVVGTAHSYTALQEATMKARSFTLYHGANGASTAAFKGAIVPNTVRIDTDDPDLGDYNSDGFLRKVAGGPIFGTVDYVTGVVTIYERHLGDDNAINRNVDYSYTLPSSVVQNIQDERTPESDSAIRANQAYLGHGGILPGTISLVIDGDNNGGGRKVITDHFQNGILYNEQNLRVGQVDYTTGRVIIEGVNTATGDSGTDGEWDLGTLQELRAPLNSRTNPDEVVANYQYSTGNRDQSFVQIGNGGYSANFGGRNTPGHSGEIVINAGGDIRLHGGAHDDSSVQIGHGGRGSQGIHGYQTDQVDRANPNFSVFDVDRSGNITVTAGGILEVLAGKGFTLSDNQQYAHIGHGGYDADGHHQGNISITTGSGEVSTTNGQIGGSGQTGGLIMTAGQVVDAYAQLGHGGVFTVASREDGDTGQRGFTGKITVNSVGDIRFTSGTSLRTFSLEPGNDYENARLYSLLGHGGYDAHARHDGGTQLIGQGIGHEGDISVISSAGSIVFQAGDHTKPAPGGAILGEGYGILHSTQLGHGGYNSRGDHGGNITVDADGDIQFFGGSFTLDESSDKRNYAHLGHGGDEADGFHGRRDVSGAPLDTISVTAGGNIDFIAGAGRRNWVQLGNGGLNDNGDQMATLNVTAGGDINFIGGMGATNMNVVGDSGYTLDLASFHTAGTGNNAPAGWAQLRWRDIRTAAINFTITVNGVTYIANGSTVQEADADGAFTAARIVEQGNPANTVGEIDLRTGSVRFFQDIDPTNTNVFTSTFNVQGGGSNATVSTETQITNPMLARAIQGPGFAASSPQLVAGFNNTRGGIVNVVEEVSTNDDNIGIRVGTFQINVPDGTVVTDNGAGRLLVSTVGSGSNLTVGQDVGDINYITGQIALGTIINPSARLGVTANYELDRTVGSDLSYAQLGNGGYDADSGTSFTVGNRGNITVLGSGDIRFHGGNGSAAYTHLGHGGLSNHGQNSGNININGQGILEFLAGNGADLTDSSTYAHLGHGGADSDGTHTGDITINVKSGLVSASPGSLLPGTQIAGLNFRGGRTDQSYVQLGHGGFGSRSGNAAGLAGAAGNTGSISAIADGAILFTSGTLREDISTNNNGAAYSMLGHGGYDSDVTSDGVAVTPGSGIGHKGDILVQSRLGSVKFYGGALANGSEGTGNGRLHFSQLGHGGFATNGEHSGNITVLAGMESNGTVNDPNADIEFKGGSTSDNDTGKINYAQLGHGGRDAIGNMGLVTEVLTVMASRDLTFAAGNDQDSYAMLGNGGQASRGNHAADIEVFAGRHIAFSGNFGAFDVINERTTDFHQATNLGATTLGTGQGDAIVDLEGSLFVPGTLRIVIPGGPTLIDNPLNAGQLIVESDTSVDVNGDTIPEVFTAGQVVGTIIANQGGNTATRVTFTADVNPDNRPSTVAISTPLVSATATYKSRENFTSWAQLGHGGYDSDDANPGTSTITMPDGNNYTFGGYRVGGPNAAERIGNIGDITVTSLNGNLTVLGGEAGNSYAQIGHGGMVNDGDQIGDIIIRVDADGSAGAAGGNVTFDARGTNFSGTHYTQLGHGGYFASGGHTGLIDLGAGGAVNFFGGRDSSYASIGHGGRNDHRLNYATVDGPAAGNSTDNDSDGNYATAGVNGDTPPDDRRDNANDRYYAGTHTGDILVRSIGSMNFIGYSDATINSGGVGYVQIGHGGFRNAADPNSTAGEGHNGAITVEAGGLTINGSGQVTAAVNPAAAITFESGTQVFSSGQIGHGGYEAFGNHFGDIQVAAAAGVDFHAKGGAANADNRTGQYSYLQIGHGGINADYDPNLPRALESTSNTVGQVFAENATTNVYYANAISGGTHLPGTVTGVNLDGVLGDDPRGQGSLMPLSTFNQTYVNPTTVRFVDHDNNVATPMVPLTPTNRGQWFHINAPGAPASGNTGSSGDINVVSLTGNLNFAAQPAAAARGREAYVQVGHGGLYTGGNHNGDVSAVAQNGNVNLLAGLGTTNDGALNSYAQIGHGGSWSGGDVTGDITVKALGTGNRLTIRAGIDNQNYAQVGHGGYDANFLFGAGTQGSGTDGNGVTTQDIRALSGTELRGQNLLYWYNPQYIVRDDLRSAVLGDVANGISDPLKFSFFSGNINVVSGTGVEITASTAGTAASNFAPGAYGQIGHGGRSTQSHSSGNILVDASGLDSTNGNAVVGAGGEITGTAGHSDQTYVQIGHGGYDGDGNHGTRDVDGDTVVDGNIILKAGTNLGGEGVVFRGGSRGDSFAQIGHGGSSARSANWLDLTGPTGTGGPDGFADSAGNQGRISIDSNGSVVFVAGTGSLLSDGNFDWINYAQLGHGGFDADVHTQVGAGALATDPNLQGTKIGHSGDISVISSAGRIIFYAGDPNRPEYASVGIGGGRIHYAQLGHGGYAARGSHFGNITADAFSDILFSGGAGDARNAAEGLSYAQLGHGGRSAQGDMGSRDLAGNALETIRVRSGRDILFEAGVGQENYAQLGNGGRDARGDHAANIQVLAERNLTFRGSLSDHLAASPGRTNGNTYQRTTADSLGLNDATNNLAGVAEPISLWNQKIVPGTINFTVLAGATALGTSFTDVRDNPTATTGTIIAADTTVVGTVNYVTGVVTMTQPIHTGTDTANNVRVTYRHTDSGVAYAQLGNGGYDSDNGGAATIGNVGRISVGARTGHIMFQAGNDNQTYAQIGHGGYETEGSNRGDIFVRAAGDLSLIGGTGNSVNTSKFMYTQIGHGGFGADTSMTVGHSGNIMVSSGTGALFSSLGTGIFNDVFDLDGNGSLDSVTFGADVSVDGLRLLGGAGLEVAGVEVAGDESSAQIGHGGRSAGGNHTGNIGVSATNDISLLGGTAYRSFTQVGHGGLAAAGNLSGAISVISENGDLTVRAGAPVAGVNTFEAYSLIGHGDDRNNNQTENAGGTRQGRIFVLADRITLDRSDNELAWIGHTFPTTANVTDPFAAQTLTTPASNLGGGYEVIGRSGLANMNNGVLVTGGTISINDSFRDRYITPNLKDGNFAFSGGNLTIDTIIDSTTSYALPATHTRSVSFLAAGDIDVNRRISSPGSGAINLIAGARLANSSIVDDPSRTGGVSGTNLNFPDIDHLWIPPTGYLNLSLVRNDPLQWGFDNGFSITSGEFDNAAGEISIDAANNGGNFNLGVGSKTGETNALGYGVRLVGGDSASEYAQLGFNTDAAADPATGSVWVSAKNDGVLVQSGSTTGTSAQIGHGGVGGNTNVKNLSGSITVRADYGSTAGNVSVLSGTGETNQAQIGHGGRQNDGNHSGDITVIGQGITVTSAASVAQIGHGGFQGTGNYSGNIYVNYDSVAAAAAGGGGALAITAGAGFDDYAQIGHGGVVATNGNRTGDIIVGQSSSVSLQGGTNKSTSAQIGHGGVGAGTGTLSGNIEVNTTGNVSVRAGASATGQGSAFAQIGHGGTGSSGVKNGNITVNAQGTQVTLAGANTAVVSNTNFAQIGHGGDGSGGNVTGNLAINAPNAGLDIVAGNQTRAFAKVGHGGYSSGGVQTGTIDIDLGGAVNLNGGADHAFAQIGHGGSLAAGNRDGAISVMSSNGNLSLISGSGLNSYTQIGHGGVGATGSHGSSLANGEVHVGIGGNILMNAGGGTDAYTQIGQGGSGAVGTHLGEICVHADGTITINNGSQGAGTRAYGQIGHGGINAPGNHGGDVTVVSGFVDPGGITMNGGSGTDQYVQIGHGGTNAGGNLSGRVYVVADKGGDLVMNGGSAAGTYAMISHGDGHGTYGSFGTGTTGGTRQGGIQYFVDGDAILNAGTGANSNVHLIHRTNDSGGLNTTNYLGGDGYQYVVNGTSSSTNGTDHNNARENESTIIAGNFGTGNIVVTNTGNLTLNLPNIPTGEFVNHSFSFIVLSTGNLNFERSFQNAGTGLVALVAGWDGVQDLSTINYNNGPCDPEIIPGSIDFNDCDRFGNNNGILTIGSATQTGPFAVGSRQGQTILRGYGINVVGSNTTAGGSTQVGFRADGSGDITGTIDVRAKQGGLTLQSGTADNAFVQIGHGTGSGAFANNVTSAATVNISFCEPGAVTLNGGGNGAFAMIGNGGGTGNYTRNGNVTITNFAGVSLAGGTGTGAFTQIGSGGLGGQGAINSVVTLNGQGNVSLAGGGANAFAHIGAGGLNHAGAITGATSVQTTGGNLTMSGGTGAGSFAQLGAGGLNADGAITGAVSATIDGSIQLTGGSGGDSYVQIGVGGSGSDGVKGGDVTVSGTGATLTGGTGGGSNVLVGNGGGTAQGTADNASGSITGNTSLTTTAGAVSMSATGAAIDNFVQVGAGGRGSVGAGNTINSTTSVITTGGGLIMNAANAAYVQIGAGGHQVDVTSLTGNVLVNAGGAIALSGGSGQNRYAQIGNGGMGSDATKSGNTTVTGSSLLMTTGSGAGSNVLIGLGGGMDQTNSDFSNGALTGNVLVTTTTDGVTMNSASAGVQAFAQIGNGGLVSDGNLSGTTTVNSAGAVALTAGAQSNTYARIGAGGSGNDGTITNAATTVTGTNLSMTAGSNSSAYTQIGAGGGATGGGNLALGNITGDVSVTMTGTIAINAGSGGSAFSQIGAGGAGFNGTSPLNTITSATNVSGVSLAMNSGGGSGAYAQIGAGGGTTGVGAATPVQGSITGNVTVGTTAGGITMGATSSGTRSYVQIGAGGSGIESGAAALGATNTITSNTAVTTVGGDLTMNSSLSSYNQIGAGGLNADGTINGTVGVTVGGALTLTGGVGTRRFAQIGNGGSQSDGAKSGAISVNANSISLNAGTTERSYAQIGHGGADASGVVTSANIAVNSVGAISLASGGNQAYTQIGHGGFNALNLTVPNSSITINNNVGTGTGDITLTGGTGTNASSIIGHGGARTDANLNLGDISATGDVSIVRSANVRVNGGSNTDSFAQIGHAGERATATFGGNIAVTTAGLVQVQGGAAGTGAYGQIGHGGRIHTGAKSGSITVSAVGPLSLLGGGASGNSAQIGHGGSASSGNLTGDIALNVGGNVSLLGGSQNETYAQVGHGGHLATGTFGGNVGLNYNFGTNQVTGAAGSFTMTGGSGTANDAYAQFGHGGTSNNTGPIVKSGHVVVGGVTSATLSGGSSSGGDNYVQVGHGGDENDGNATGSVALLSSGLVTLNGGGAGSDGYVQIGLGGHEATGSFGTVGDSVTVIGLGIDLNGGNGLRSSVQIGSGGYNADGALTGNVFINVNPLTNLPVGGGAITVNAGGGTESFAQIGLGGSAQDGDKNGNTTIQGSSLEVVAGGGAAAHAQIGSGTGIRSDLTDFGSGAINTTTTVTTTSGGVTVSAAGAGAHSFAQIGGGGLIADGALSGNTGVSTVVNATGDIVLTGGGNSNNYAMIGLGGSGGDGVKSLAGTSVTGASVTMTGGSGASAFTQIGSGGGMTGGNNVSTGAVTGDTTLTTTVGGITATSGTGGNSYAFIGTGGSNLGGDINATVIVNSAGGLALNSANGTAGSFTQVGLGGLNADGVHTGTTTVAAAGAISLTGGANNDTYSQIGSGGAGSDGNKVNASVSVRGASVAMTSGAGFGAYTQIGSGGGATGAGGLPTGNATGAVNVVTTVGGIALAGGGDRAYSQIGQGGGGRNGDFTGEIQIVSADGLGITGGSVARAYALVGNGGIADAGGFTTGLREGNVLISAEGLTQLADGSSTAFIGHRGATGVSGASRLALVTGQLNTTANATGVTGMIANVIGAGTAEIGVTNGNLVVNGAALNYNSANAIDLFASGNTTILGSLQNAGAGALNLVAGWDATTGLTETINPAIFPPISALALDYSAVAADSAAYTNNAGVVSIGDGSQTTPLAVGSALGQTNLLGDGVSLVAGSVPGAFAQVGFRGTSNALISGTINVGVGATGLSLQSAAQSGAFTQIGHGGAGATSAAVQADINLDFVNGGDLTVTAGNGNAAYAQIGHGGSNYASSIIGDITASGTIGTLSLNGGGTSSQAAYAQIGHGGDAATGSKNGDISLEAEEVSIDAGSGFRSGAQIGHGGRGGVGNLAGSIDVTTTVGDLSMTAAGGNVASAQIGHGGLGYSGLVTDQPITVDVAGSLLLQGGSANQASAQIGHGGANASGGNYSGDVVVTVGEDLAIAGGNGLTAFAQIGHGGALVTSTLAGNITVSTGGDANLSAPNSAASGAYAKIGHGDDMRGSFGPAAGSGSRAGDIEVAAGGSLTMNQALIGHANSTSNATSAGTTQIGVSWLAPANPAGGSLVANATSEFSGDELRFYVPRRANNQVAAGAMMNGVAYTGGLSDPYPTKRADEYANYVQTTSGTTQLAEHDSTFGSGPAPATAGSYAFYFDTIVQGTPVEPPLPPEPPTPPLPPAPDYRDSILDDRVIDDWIREQEGLFSTPGSTSIFYEGFTQYGPNGESIYNFNNAAGMGSDDEEDVLRRQLELLEEQAEQAEQAGQSAGTGDTSQGAE